MGPTLLFDKSFFEGLPAKGQWEIARYFWTGIPPVLLIEILADLKDPKPGQTDPRERVSRLAGKANFTDSQPIVHYRDIATMALLGKLISTEHRQIPIAGATRIPLKDGGHGAFVDTAPEKHALMRWRSGVFDEAEAILAKDWRRSTKGFDLERFKTSLGRPATRIESLGDLASVVDRTLADETLQPALLDWFLEELSPHKAIREWTWHRWRYEDRGFIRSFAPYVHHCLRVMLFFNFGLMHDIVTPRRTNRVDMEYFFYAPFAQVFVSSDNLHADLAPFILDADQSFQWGVTLNTEIRDLLAKREERRQAPDDGKPAPAEPPEGGVIQTLWKKHLGEFSPQIQSSRPVKQPDKTIREQMGEFIEQAEKLKKKRPQEKWPTTPAPSSFKTPFRPEEKPDDEGAPS